MGFDLVYPADWIVRDLNPAIPVIKTKLENEAKGEEDRHRTSCLQFYFSAKPGGPKSTFIALGEATKCIGQEPNLASFALGTMTSLKKKYILSETEYGSYSVKGIVFWTMRTKAAKVDHSDEVETIEYVGAVLPKGIVFWTAHCDSAKAQEEFEHARLHFENGGDTEIVPAHAFKKTVTADQNPKKR